ncbi:Gfo/Idh/MocA family protein [Guptibacillus sedimenti]|uniref:Gfo/Idh/MocA family protein n=1 Tax=Guptibacillus sedimenti TaxID=3025680 RepID=UPI00235E0B91|nr:Gfo/Idh/MocA family oxidoreductase [Pseudalkalibacillus sedimenti]
MKQVHIGIIGLGTIAETSHLVHLKELEGVTITAVADLNKERAKQIAETYHIPLHFSDTKKMLDTAELDAVVICTPNTTHIPIARMAAEKNIHVLMEKPIGTDLSQVEGYLELANQHHVMTMVGMTHRFRNDAAILKEYIQRGKLGNIYYAKAKLLRRRGTPKGWFTDKGLSGGGAMMDIGVHVLDLAWWLIGTPNFQSISGHTLKALGAYKTRFSSSWESSNKQLNPSFIFDVEDFGSAWIRFSNGVVLSLEVAWAMNGEEDGNISIEILGDGGGGSLSPLSIFEEENDVVVKKHPYVENISPFRKELQHFIDCIRSGDHPLPDGAQGYEVLKMLHGVYESSEKQKEISYS